MPFTQRPDRFCAGLLEGRVGLLCDGLPFGYLLPGTMDQFFRTSQDRAFNWMTASMLLLLRYFCMAATLLIPGLYIALVTFHPEAIPVKLALSIVAAKQEVPFSTVFEVLIMLVAFEVLQEAGLRLPSPIGATVSILGGLVVDRYADVLSLEVSTLAVWQRLNRWLPLLHRLCGTKRHVVQVDEGMARMEGIRAEEAPASPVPVRLVKIVENGITYEVDFAQGHKTGFFCDQRDNRLKVASLVKGATVLDLCCYSGGFSIAAKMLGGAAEVTAVDLEEKAVAMAKRNGNINHQRIDFVHADALVYARQMVRNGRLFDAVLLDPPKFIVGRDGYEEGIKKYHDLNMLGLQCVRPGGLFVTCSCSGLLSPAEFEHTVIKAAQRQGRKLQIMAMTGPGWDHPFLSTYPEGRYLKVLWAIAL